MQEQVMLFGFITSVILELGILIMLHNDNYTKIARYYCYPLILLISFSFPLVLFEYFDYYAVIFAVFSIFRILNLSRIAVMRMNLKELTQKYQRSFVWLTILSGASLYIALIEPEIDLINILVIFSLASSILILISTAYSYIKWQPKMKSAVLEEKLPTVTICIPARNETQDLPECIESMLESSYSKLEIIVLDDCSHDKTPEVIKEYAHQGVRFIKGTEPDEDWLPKNQAMNKLFDEAKGDVLIYAGVDVRFDKNSVNQIVNYIQNGHEMIGILPRRGLSSEFSVFIQPLRYWWELCVPRFIGGRPPVLSTCWAIKKASLKRLGEFDSYRKSVQPEAHFSKKLNHNYSFIIAGNNLGISSIKAPRDQYDTAIRTRYPLAKRRLELVPLVLLAEIIIFFTPIIGIVYGIFEPDKSVLIMSLVTMTILVSINLYISFLTVYRTWILAIFTLPFLLLEEWFILIRSTLAYEFGVVMWKDRNICLPMFKVEKNLPKI